MGELFQRAGTAASGFSPSPDGSQTGGRRLSHPTFVVPITGGAEREYVRLMYPGTWAARTPDKPALVMAGSGRTVTYGELDERSLRLAHVLQDAGLGVGDVVALLSDNRPEA